MSTSEEIHDFFGTAPLSTALLTFCTRQMRSISRILPSLISTAFSPEQWLPSLRWAYSSLPSLEASEISMILVPVACYWIYSTFLFVLSVLRITSVELHRIPTNQKMRPPNKITVRHVLQKVAIQHLIQCLVAYALAVGTRPDDMATRPMEHPLLCLAKICIAAIMLDSYQYWMHRWMHTNRFLYRHFHSVHHELTVLYAYGALYNHPVEGFIMDTIGSGLPSLIVDMHPWTSAIFFSLATLKTVDDHCGYALPWDPFQRFFRNNAVYHDIHHWGKGRMYNFSQPFFTYWDIWMGTDYEIAMKKAAQAKAKTASSTPSLAPPSVSQPNISAVKPSRKAHLSAKRYLDDTDPTAEPPSPCPSSSDDSIADSALGSSCGESEGTVESGSEGDESVPQQSTRFLMAYGCRKRATSETPRTAWQSI